MMKILIPVVLVLLGVGGGAAVGIVMKKPPEAAEGEEGYGENGDMAAKDGKPSGKPGDDKYGDGAHDDVAAVYELRKGSEKADDSAYFELSRKLIVPVVNEVGDRYFVALELHVEMTSGTEELASTHEPKLRDALLRTVIGFAHTGAFDDTANPKETFEELSLELKRSARRVLGDDVRSVLIGDLIRQGA